MAQELGDLSFDNLDGKDDMSLLKHSLEDEIERHMTNCRVEDHVLGEDIEGFHEGTILLSSHCWVGRKLSFDTTLVGFLALWLKKCMVHHKRPVL